MYKQVAEKQTGQGLEFPLINELCDVSNFNDLETPDGHLFCVEPNDESVCSENEIKFAETHAVNGCFIQVSNDEQKEWMLAHECNLTEGEDHILIHRPTQKVAGGRYVDTIGNVNCPWWGDENYENDDGKIGFGKNVIFAPFLEPTFNLAVLKILNLETKECEYRVLLSTFRKPSLIKMLETNTPCLLSCLWSIIFDYLYSTAWDPNDCV